MLTTPADETTESKSIVDASNVTKRFGNHDVLTGIDLAIGKGEILLLMGPNGAGKSVLLSCLSGSALPSGGEIRLFDEVSPVEAQTSISVMFQGAMADPELSGRENLRFYEDLHPNGTDRWRDLVERLEIADEIDRPVEEYSGGMRRKIEIAITLTIDVPFYVLDEPTIELDLATIRELHDLLLEMRADEKTILVTSHAPLDAQIADRIAFLRDGTIIANGHPDDLFERLPPVLRVRGAVPPEELLVGNELFRRGDEIRGFLATDVDVERVESALRDRSGTPFIDTDEPSHTDLFNYYTYIHSISGNG
ncbi:ABC transporter ATP-binding protein [Halosolutus gelatinilyticus]|uniref:ABC transporter ATP-binding protein n=1 Tax=Halosolutus gelatinilyticus TaxID=2931975 RepID=UPI001FF32C7F|nr:ABC transporter ATP-binding protein [Halosolutus gelatinilyticus]